MSSARRDRREDFRIPKGVAGRLVHLRGRRAIECSIDNFSRRGAGIRAHEPVPVSSIVHLEVQDPARGAGRRLLARVQWAGIAGRDVRAGLRFVEWREIGRERRRHPRKDVGAFVRFRRLAKGCFDWESQPGMLRSLSEGGLSLTSPRPVPADAILEVALPGRTVRARVVRVERYDRERWLAAASFAAA
jgi:hypothetical protein